MSDAGFIILLVVVILAAVFIPLMNSPSISITGDGVLLINSSGNFTETTQQIQSKFLQPIELDKYGFEPNDSIDQKTFITDSSCQFTLQSDGSYWSIYEPGYYIFSPSYSSVTDSCSCPEDFDIRQKGWSSVMWGFLYQPQKGFNVTDIYGEGFRQCLETNCYSSGMTYIGEPESLIPYKSAFKAEVILTRGNQSFHGYMDQSKESLTFDNMEVRFKPTIPCDTYDLAVFNGRLVDRAKLNALTSDVQRAQGDFRFRIENTDRIKQEINGLMISPTTDSCILQGDQVVCKEKNYGNFEVYISQMR